MDFKYYYQNDQEVLDDLATSKDKLLTTQTSGEIEKVLSEIKIVLDFLDSYSSKQEFVTQLFAEIFSDRQLFSRQGIQRIFGHSGLWVSLEDTQKEHLTPIIIQHYQEYRSGTFTWAVQNFIYHELCDFNSKPTYAIYQQIIELGADISDFGAALYFNCNVNIDFIGPTR